MRGRLRKNPEGNREIERFFYCLTNKRVDSAQKRAVKKLREIVSVRAKKQKQYSRNGNKKF
jgi:hypothetical protein